MSEPEQQLVPTDQPHIDPPEVESFDELPLCDELKLACRSLNYTKPTRIQAETLPYTLGGRDVIALAETGSGKTLAFALPMLQALLEKPKPFFGLVLAPARELVVQIGDHFKAIGAKIGLKVAVIIGSMDLKAQTKILNSAPHVIVGTPGRILFHMENTKAFAYANIKCLVLDEADKLLSDDFAGQLDRIVEALPLDRRTYLFSATMTNKVNKLERAALRDPVKVAVSTKYQTVRNLFEEYMFFPAKMKEVYVAYILQQRVGSSIIIFTITCLTAIRICLLARKLGHQAVTINGKMSQTKRLGSLARFRQHDAPILVATDVASRGLDIPSVDLVINYDLPSNPKDYIHRVGRTARAGKAGRALSFVTQYDVEDLQRIEHCIEHKLQEYQPSGHEVKDMQSQVLGMQEMVEEKMRVANDELKMKMDKFALTEEQEEKLNKLDGKRKKRKVKNRERRMIIDV